MSDEPDVVDRLYGMGWPSCTAGADEIVRLRAIVADLRAVNEKLLARVAASADQSVERVK